MMMRTSRNVNISNGYFLRGIIALVSTLICNLAYAQPDVTKSAKTKRPNIVFILSDDHRWDYLSSMGHPFIQTPNIDSIAEKGVLFENAFVTSSLCSPSRASFLTGQYPQQHGVQNNYTPWDNQNVTFFEHLKKAGYQTAFMGKWHMPGGIPELRGVDQFVTFLGQGAYYDTSYIVNGKSLKVGETPVPGVPITGYITDDLTNFALKYIEDSKEEPFALYLSHKAVHLPMTPDEEMAGRYDNKKVELPEEADSWLALADSNFKHFLWSSLEEKVKDYAETAVAMDQQIGRVLHKLNELGLADNTLIVYAGDNGYLWGEHRQIDKRWSYEESIRVPFVVSYPKALKQPGRRSQEMILNLDLAPTILQVAGIDVPEYMQGESLLPVIENKQEEIRSAWLYKYFEDFPYPVPEQMALRTKRYKLIEYARGKEDELFDIQADPKEKNNLIEEASLADILTNMKAQMKQLSVDVSMPAPSVIDEGASK